MKRVITHSLVVAATWCVAAPAASAADLPLVGEDVVAQKTNALPAPSKPVEGLFSLASGYGNIAWLDGTHGGKATRVVLKPFGRRAISRRVPFATGVRIVRGVDSASGRVVDRVSVQRCSSASCKSTRDVLLLPGSLRPSGTVWAHAPGPGSPYSDGVTVSEASTVVSVRTQLDAPQATTPQSTTPQATTPAQPAYTLPASRCVPTREAPTPLLLPALTDCATAGVTLRGHLLALFADRPSQTEPDHFNTTQRVDLLDLDAPAAGWRQVASAGYGKGGSHGAQALCLLDDGVAILSGDEDFYGADVDANASTVSITPAGAIAPTRQGRAPNLAANESDYNPAEHIACDGKHVFGFYAHRFARHGKQLRTTRIVRLSVPPVGAVS